MNEFLRTIPAHKLWSLAILIITPGLVLVAVRFGALTPERVRPWGAFFGVICIGLWIVLIAMDDPRVDFVMAFTLSFTATIEWIAWFERRSAKHRTP
jgi:hypothetical protein